MTVHDSFIPIATGPLARYHLGQGTASRLCTLGIGQETGILGLWLGWGENAGRCRLLGLDEALAALFQVRADLTVTLEQAAMKQRIIDLLPAARANAEQYAQAVGMGLVKLRNNLWSLYFGIGGGAFASFASWTLTATDFLADRFDRNTTSYDDALLGAEVSVSVGEATFGGAAHVAQENFYEKMGYKKYLYQYRQARADAIRLPASYDPDPARDLKRPLPPATYRRMQKGVLPKEKPFTVAENVAKSAGFAFDVYNLIKDIKDADERTRLILEHQAKLKHLLATLAIRSCSTEDARCGWDVLQWGEYLAGRRLQPEGEIRFDVERLRDTAGELYRKKVLLEVVIFRIGYGAVVAVRWRAPEPTPSAAPPPYPMVMTNEDAARLRQKQEKSDVRSWNREIAKMRREREKREPPLDPQLVQDILNQPAVKGWRINPQFLAAINAATRSLRPW